MDDTRQDYKAGREAGLAWIQSAAFNQLSKEQLLALPANLDKIVNNSGDLVHQDENADHAADAYAALTGDRECHSRATVRAFWEPILQADPASYSEWFYYGFLMGVAAKVF
jgi:hypothetical protein